MYVCTYIYIYTQNRNLQSLLKSFKICGLLLARLQAISMIWKMEIKTCELVSWHIGLVYRLKRENMWQRRMAQANMLWTLQQFTHLSMAITPHLPLVLR